MAKRRRMGTETSETRARLLDVTEQIMLSDGYAAVTSRSVAKEAGVTAALVHYYFATLDDLFLAVLGRRAEQQLERQRQLLSTSDRPLHALWSTAKDQARTGLVLEFASVANHRKAVRSELARSAEQFRTMRLELLREHIEASIDPVDLPAVAILLTIDALGVNFVLEQSLGMTTGHAETEAVVEAYLDRIEP